MAVARLAGLGGVTPVSKILAGLEALADPPSASPVPAPAEKNLPAAIEPVPERLPEREARPKKKTVAANETVESASPPAPEGIPDPDEAAKRWEAALDYLREKSISDFRHLSRVSFAGMEEGIVRLSGPFSAYEALENRSRRTRLAEALASAFGRPLEFSFSAVAKPDNREKDRELRQRLANRPEVRRILELFDGAVLDCRPPGGAPAIEETEGLDESAGDDADRLSWGEDQ